MNVNNIDEDIRSCCGCGVCAALCPVSAIKMKVSEDGFLVPCISDNLCINCGQCLNVCYKIKKNDAGLTDFSQTEYYSAASKDEKNLLASSSGGIITEIAQYAVENGHTVCGVTYDTERNIAVAKIVKDRNELYLFRGSKYIPAWTEDAYKKMHGKCMVIGTPCQIYGLKKMATLNKRSDKFIFVDFICHGVPSYNVWFRYIDDFKRKNKIKAIEELSFKSKKYGWHMPTVRIQADGKEYLFKRNNDNYFTVYDDGQANNGSCYDCNLRQRFGCSDLRVGDYWGELFKNNQRGVSLIAIGTKKGNEIFNSIKDKLEYSPQSATSFFTVRTYKYNKRARDAIFLALKENNDLKSTIKKYQQYFPINRKIDIKIKTVLPLFLYLFYRKTIILLKSYLSEDPRS